MKKTLLSVICIACGSALIGQVSETFMISKKYLNLPVQLSEDRAEMVFELEDDAVRKFVIRLSNGQPDYWVYSDVSDFMGKEITVTFPEKSADFSKI